MKNDNNDYLGFETQIPVEALYIMQLKTPLADEDFNSYIPPLDEHELAMAL